MFTGLVEEIGSVRELQTKAGSTDFYIECARIPIDLQLGDSISVNGVCLTATWFDDSAFSATATPETLRCTNLGTLTTGSKVNLERSITMQTRMGGHIVQGHVDCTGTVASVTIEGDSQLWKFRLPTHTAAQLIHKGSVAVNGVSLTVAALDQGSFTVALIPKTIQLTTFQYMKQNDSVNIETDLIGKYVFRFMEAATLTRQD